MAAITNASPSVIGPAYITPIILNVFASNIAIGVKNNICLDNVKNADLLGFPIAWNIIPDAICIPLNMVNIKNVLNVIHANSLYNTSPDPNNPINFSGMVWNNIKAVVDTVALKANTAKIVFFTRA